MNGQSSIFDATPTSPHKIARTSDPETSHAAARAVSYKTGSQKARLLELYRQHPAGLTDEEISVLAGMERHAATKRCSDLRNDGKIEVVGVRKGHTGLKQRVCRAVA